MAISKQKFSDYIKEFNFRGLFNDMGWNNDNTNQSIIVDDKPYQLQAVAQKSGFRIFVCFPDESGYIPDYNTRKKIETKITKLFQEHLIIFLDKNQKNQLWQLVVRQTGKPTKMTETRYSVSQNPELLYQRASGLFFTLDEEEKITIVDVTQRVSENFQQNTEKVTKHFYDRFKKEHTAFLSFIQGIEDRVNKDWYASLMLNRLMFCYFIQKKGFLDDNKNYLRDKLKDYQQKKGRNKFFSFYRQFLLVLFHEGLGAPSHTKELKSEIGNIPYLNGGLFDEHELENLYKNIDIEDKAFERIFNFFDEYEWHLDTRITATGKDINPDVIGYIFEKYINDRAQMGAYYTKEDITDYISKNCIIPYLFNETKRQYPESFLPENEIWAMLKESEDKYIYDTSKYGINQENIYGDLPDEISIGLDSNHSDVIELRKDWNKPAPENVALPNEIWREVIERRQRYIDIRGKIKDGTINNITDFISNNLNLRQFAQDIIENITDYKFIETFYKSLLNISILDPTCGSGAFLFAAMNILEPLYEGCLQRMESYLLENPSTKNDFFKDQISLVYNDEHPNIQYFIFKSIILKNLFGVDIMKEAVEVAKLRLFLKLVATVDADYSKENLGIEPLPDIDFNIRSGNSLVGFATESQLQKGLRYTLDGLIAQPIIERKCNLVSIAFNEWKEEQLTSSIDFKSIKNTKENLRKHLKELNLELNSLLYKQTRGVKFNEWIDSHLPFHWFAEFYEIISERGGFDVIIGNPPYVEYSKVSKLYKLSDYSTIDCGNLHAFCIERALQIRKDNGYLSFIVPLALISTPRMESAISLLKKKCDAYFSSFECRPAKLFEGADIRLTIAILIPKQESKHHFFSTRLIKFATSERSILFENLCYSDLSQIKHNYNLIPKISNPLELSIYNKLFSSKRNISYYVSENPKKNKLFYSYGFRYWAKVLDKPTFFKAESAKKSTGEKDLNIINSELIPLIGSALSSSLFYWYYVVTSDAHNFTKHIIYNFPLDEYIDNKLTDTFRRYQIDLETNSAEKTANYKSTGTIIYREYFVKKSKHIIDEIDQILATHLGLTNEELDLIINYDIKYRMGNELVTDVDEF